MPIETGTRIGPYEVIAPIGAGGMGEVCRARDTKLNRDVALKMLPTEFATDPERLSRFQREAQLLAAMNHPHIAAIYGLEDAAPASPGQPAIRAIVMELVDGGTLAGPLPLDEAMRVARQIADALEYAHDRGIIHRDLKPANVKVTPDGTVKVLDFGLAKAMDDSSESTLGVRGTMSPTLSLAATHAGVIMGTAAYMAPEQAKGRPADRRSDIWSFGVVLYEILAGNAMFGGDSVPETLASVMKDQITFGKLPAQTPVAIRTLVARCLERDPRRRLQSIAEARIVLDDAIAGVGVEQAALPLTPVNAPATKWPWAVAAIAVITAIATLAWSGFRPVPAPAGVVRFTIPPPEGGVFTAYRGASSNLAVSPDGRYVAFVADEPRRDRTIWVRALDSLVAQRLDRTEGATYPFWSPDSQHIAYFAGGKLMRVSMAGGAPLAIADAVDGEGGTWFQAAGQEGVIVFAAGQTGPLQRVLAQGGVPTPVTTLGAGETGHAFPQFLPDGQRFLYLARGEKPAIYVQAIGSDSRTFVVESVGRASFSPPGLLLYMRATTLLAHRWNIESLRLEGEPVAIADDVRNGGVNGRNAFAVSTNGVLAYRFGGAGTEGQIRWYARDGKPGDIVLEAGDYGMIALSPDDRYMAVVRGLQDGRDLWLKDLTSGAFSRLTSALGAETDPVWSPDSRRVAYVGEIESQRRLYETVIGSGKHSPILAGVQSFLEDWTNDGRAIVLRGPTGRSVTQFPAPVENQASPAEGTPQTMLEEVAYAVDTFQVSPDGKWVAYVSAESGQPEIMVASFPAFTNRRQISTDSAGAVQPLWRTDGKELFFVSRRESVVTAVDVNAGATLETGPPRVLFKTLLNTNGQIHFYAVTRDGQRFLVREPVGTNMGTEQLRIVTNWAALVR